jgi:maltose alpha-D-glucosyltransferase / alpha-amylase
MDFAGRFLENDPLWYKDAIIYEVHVKAFCDSNGDGIGDFRGLMHKLDYLKDLGINTIWLLPFYPSPLKDDGYDIADYFNVHPDYGTLRDFREFLKSAHYRGLRVVTELVLNHTSDQHRWFQRARLAKPGSALRDFYVWSDDPQKYLDARIIFKDFETSNWAWDPVAKAYYWHRFYAHQPDLNFDNPQVHKELIKVLDFWLDMGVDGLRLDAVPYLYEREGTNCENLPQTHDFLKKLRAHVDSKYLNRMLLAEANQWPEDAVAYFGNDDECNMAFHFPIMPRIFMSLWMEDRFPIIDILDQTPTIPERCQWGLFLRNHDELTLEMVSDEERDYMYRVYAKDHHARINLGIRRRLAPLMGNNRRKIDLINILLLSLPGTPIIYYGDELGMGDNYYLGDRNGVRTPMQWSPDRNAGFSKANPQSLYLPVNIDPEYHYEALNVENQERNLSSILWWYRRVIGTRKRFKAFGRGNIEFLFPDNPKVLVFIRRYDSEILLIVANLSRFSQAVKLELARYAGFVPEEAFSGNKFPVITDTPYVLTLGFNDFYWFVLRKPEDIVQKADQQPLVEFRLRLNWLEILEGEPRKKLEGSALPRYLKGCRWFGAKAQTVRAIEIIEDIPIEEATGAAMFHLLLLEVYYTEGSAEDYLLPVSFAGGHKADEIRREFPQAVIAKVIIGGTEGILYDCVYHAEFRKHLLMTIIRRRKLKGRVGELSACQGKMLRRLLDHKNPPAGSQVLKAEQSNTSILYEHTFFFKLYRRLVGEGINPDLEITRFLTEQVKFPHISPFAGTIEYHRHGSTEPVVLGLLQGLIPNAGDAWTYTLETLGRFFEEILSLGKVQETPPQPAPLREASVESCSTLLHKLIGEFYLGMVNLLGKRTGELHLALASNSEHPEFTPEPFSKLYQRSVYQSMRNLVRRTMNSLQRHHEKLPEHARDEARSILDAEPEILGCLERITQTRIDVMKIRIHGDYHLGQVLYTGKDFVIIDFEGEPARALSERRLKRTPFRDVAGMIRSFHYAAHSAFLRHVSIRQENGPLLEPWIEPWYHCVSSTFFQAYLETVEGAAFVPQTKEELKLLMQSFLLDKAVYELGYELNNRPDWVLIPIRGIRMVLREFT